MIHLFTSFLSFFVLILCYLDYKTDKVFLKKQTIVYLIFSIVIYNTIYGTLLYYSVSIEDMISMLTLYIQKFSTPLFTATSSFLSGVFIFICTFYLSSFVDYGMHRYINHSHLFFWTHKYHHTPTLISSYMPGIVARPFSLLTGIVVTYSTIFIFLTLSTLTGGTPIILLYFIFLLQTFILISSHSSFLRSLPRYNNFLEKILLVSPRDHLLHHSVEVRCNYGNLSYLGDYLFKTYMPNRIKNVGDINIGLGNEEDYISVITFGKITLKKIYE